MGNVSDKPGGRHDRRQPRVPKSKTGKFGGFNWKRSSKIPKQKCAVLTRTHDQ